MHSGNRCTMKARKVVTAGLLHRYDTGNEGFLSQIVTGDETWIQHSQPKSTRQSMEWRHTISPCKKKFKSQQEKAFVRSFGLIKELFLWTSCLGRQQWFYQYTETLRNSHALIRLSSSSRKKDVRGMAPHDNFRPHTSARTTWTITKFGWTVSLLPIYSPDHVSWDLNLSDSLKDSRQVHLDGDDKELQNMVHQWLQEKESIFSQAPIRCRCSNVEVGYRDGYHAVLKNEGAFSVVVVKLCVVKQ